jgi:two-component system, LuxR family, response regulator FixJ
MAELLRVQPETEPELLAYVIDDSSEMRRSLHALLSTFDCKAWPFSSARDFLDNINQLRPAPILLDIRMPEMDGIELMRALARRHIDWPVIIMTGHAEIPLAVQSMKLGALDFLEKPFEPDLLHETLMHAVTALQIAADQRNKTADARRLLSQLTKREVEVALGLKAGRSNKLIAFDLGVSVRTIEMHRAHVMTKTGQKHVAGLIQLVVDSGGEEWLRTHASKLSYDVESSGTP